MSVWTLTDLHKTWRSGWFSRERHAALRGASLTVEEGERVALIGPSGSGKTTLARCGLGLVRQDRGRVEILGRDLDSLGPRERRALRAQAQIVFQDPRAMLHPDVPIGALLEESAALHRTDRDPRQLALDVLASVGLDHRADALPAELSGGERRRAGIARVALTRPRLLVADEPTSGLDAVLKRRIVELLVSIVGGRCAVVLVTHDLAAVAPVCDRVVVMADGLVVESFTPRDLASGYAGDHATTRELLAAVGRVP